MREIKTWKRRGGVIASGIIIFGYFKKM